MIKVYESTERVFNHNGLKILHPYKAIVYIEDNGDYYLDLESPLEDLEYLQEGNIVRVNTRWGEQGFRLTNPRRKNNRITVRGYHLWKDSSKYVIVNSYVENKDCNDALDHFRSACDVITPFTTISDINILNSMRVIRKSFEETISLMIEKWGGHLYRDNWVIGIKQDIGQDRGAVIKYGKNSQDIEVEEDWDNVVTKMLPVGYDGITLPEVYLTSDIQYDVPYTKGISSTMLNERLKDIGTTPDIRLKRLRRLINAKKIVRICESHSGLTGLIIENTSVTINNMKHEFDGMWASSLTDSTSKGKPDIEAVDLTTRLHDLNDALEVTTKPVIFDGDTGGKTEHFVFTVRTLERLGISAIIIEDKTGLKKNSLLGTDAAQIQDSVENFCYKIGEGKRAQITPDFMIIARCESLIAGKSVDDAIERCLAYVKAGADGIMIHSKKKTGEDIKEFCQRFRKQEPSIPIVVVPTTYNHVTEDELASWGVNVVIYANHLLRAAYPAMVKCAESILTHGRSLEANDICMPIKDILELIPGTK